MLSFSTATTRTPAPTTADFTGHGHLRTGEKRRILYSPRGIPKRRLASQEDGFLSLTGHTWPTTDHRYDGEIKTMVQQHTDYPLVASLPAGSYTTRCRLIAALGDDRSRFPKTESLQAASGIAPLTTQSGRQRFVSSRWACSKFMRQTFHEFAGLTITRCKWSAAYYKLQLSRGKSAQMAKRALAYKWQRITYRCWQDRVPYDEAKYLQRLRATGSPLIALMEA